MVVILEAEAPEAVGKTMKQHFEAFIDDMRSTHGSNLAAVILYGSAAAGDFVPNRSDYNLLVALNRIAPVDLRNAHASVREWQKMGHPVPVYFTVSELQNAADVFPIEFHQMETARKVLYGTDVLEGLKISDDFLRHQTEYELRSKLILLRRSYIPASTSTEGLEYLLTQSLNSFSAIFRAVLLLTGGPTPATKHEITDAIVRHLKLNAAVFDRIFDIREGRAEEVSEIELNELFGAYMEQIETVIHAVDAAGRETN